MLIRKFLAGLLVSLLAFAPAETIAPLAPPVISVSIAAAAFVPLVPAKAHAATTAQTAAVLSGIQSWSLPGSSADLYFARNAGSCAINRIAKPCLSLISTVRASTESCLWLDGHYSLAANNVPCLTDEGTGHWQASTNIALWSRDLTNANWTKTSTTAALDQTGVYNDANSASSLTATGTNGTACAAAITSASASRSVSLFVYRITGTGAVSISQDGGSTYTAITTKVGSAWYRPTPTDFSGLTQTVTNPQICIKLAVSGDKIGVDVVDLEALTFLTPPKVTTTVAVAGAADVITLTGAALNAFKGNTGAFMASFGGAPYATNSAPALNVGLAFTDTGNSRWALHNVNTSGTQPLMAVGNGTTVNSVSDINVAANTAYKVAVRWSSVSTDLAMSLNGRAAVTGAYQFAGGITSMAIGSNGASGAQINEYVKRLVVWPTLSNSQLASVSQ